MKYAKQQEHWLRRRITIRAWIAAGMPRKEIAARLKISRQRVSQLALAAKNNDLL